MKTGKKVMRDQPFVDWRDPPQTMMTYRIARVRLGITNGSLVLQKKTTIMNTIDILLLILPIGKSLLSGPREIVQ